MREFARNIDAPPLLAVGMVEQQLRCRRAPQAAMRRVILAFWLAMVVLVVAAIGGSLAAGVLLNERTLAALGIS